MNNYKELIGLIKKYKKTKIWQKIDGDDIFRIKGYKKPVYVSILGKNKECTDLNIFYGKEELYIQYDMIYGEYVGFPDNCHRLTCYKFIIDDTKGILDKEEGQRLSKNNLNRNILATRYQANKKPRLVTEEEAELLINIMKDLLKIIDYINETNFSFPEKLNIAEKYAFEVKDDKVTYKVEKFPIEREIKVKSKKLDEEKISKINFYKQKGTFGVGLFNGPFYIEEEAEFCKMMIVSDLETGEIIDMKVFSSKEEKDLASYLMDAFIKVKRYPQNIAIPSTKDFLLIQDLLVEFKINYNVDNDLYPLFMQYESARAMIGR